MRVRVTLSETEIEKNEILGTIADFQLEIMNRILITILLTLAVSATAARGKLEYTLTEPRYMRQGKAMTHGFMEWIT